MNIPIPDIITTWQFWVVAVAVYILAEIFKQIPYLKDGNNSWLVNLFSIVIGVILLCLLLGWTAANVVFGILAAAASTLAYEIWQNVLASIVGKKETAAAQIESPNDDETKVGGTQ